MNNMFYERDVTMNIRLFNARILTMEEGRAVFEGECWIKDETILFVGDENDLEQFYKKSPDLCIVWDQEIDCYKNLLMPGFKNAHTHSGMTILRSYADDMPLQNWLFDQVFPIEGKLNGEDVYYLTQLAILEYCKKYLQVYTSHMHHISQK